MMSQLFLLIPTGRWLLLGLLLGLTAASGWAQPCPLQLDSLSSGTYPSDCLLTFADSTGQLTPRQLDLSQFKPVGTTQPNFGTDGLTHWLTFTCQNAAKQAHQFVLEVDIVYADEMSFYVLDGQRISYQIEHDSWHVPLWKRSIPSRYFAFPLNLTPGQTVRVLLRAQEEGGTLITPIHIWERSAYELYYSTETNILILPAIILLFLTVVGLGVFIVSRNLIWLFYAVHAFGTAVYNLNIEGVLAHYLPDPFNTIKGYALGVSLSYMANLLFTQQYVYKRLPKPIGWLRWATYGLIGVQATWFLYLLVMPFQDHTADVALLITGITAAFMLMYLLTCLAKGSDEARIYLLAIAPFLLIVLVRVLDSAGILETQDWHYYLRYYAPLFEIIVLGIGATRQLIHEREATLIQLGNTQKEVILTQETERRRIAQDLHDDVGTSLLALRGKLPPASEEAYELINQIIANVRTVSHNLMPDELTMLGLGGALAETAERLGAASGIRFLFVSAGEVIPLPQVKELAIYRAVLELMHNVVRHSGATEAVVQLVYHPDGLNIMVEDNGHGFGNHKADSASGIGLKNVASRTEWLGGRMAIDTSVRGTTIRLDVPYT
ncbi:sensor histidine kinase [Fibrella aquatilis]|uniref:histidine kinase n=1 Tax=Fibrella aquatilis TaxID=2817059 RepID=A0A939K325_9BACT|nr:7TM-DISM domain-containing protein [Fibrella aquatilis]MBO0934691.1 hypothetical protein [Fibrella aquatilis]